MELTKKEARKMHNNKERICFSDLKKSDDIKCIRFRLLGDRYHNQLDISYMVLKVNGTEYKVYPIPFHSLTKQNYKTKIYNQIKDTDLFIKNLFDNISIFIG